MFRKSNSVNRLYYRIFFLLLYFSASCSNEIDDNKTQLICGKDFPSNINYGLLKDPQGAEISSLSVEIFDLANRIPIQVAANRSCLAVPQQEAIIRTKIAGRNLATIMSPRSNFASGSDIILSDVTDNRLKPSCTRDSGPRVNLEFSLLNFLDFSEIPINRRQAFDVGFELENVEGSYGSSSLHAPSNHKLGAWLDGKHIEDGIYTMMLTLKNHLSGDTEQYRCDIHLDTTLPELRLNIFDEPRRKYHDLEFYLIENTFRPRFISESDDIARIEYCVQDLNQFDGMNSYKSEAIDEFQCDGDLHLGLNNQLLDIPDNRGLWAVRYRVTDQAGNQSNWSEQQMLLFYDQLAVERISNLNLNYDAQLALEGSGDPGHLLGLRNAIRALGFYKTLSSDYERSNSKVALLDLQNKVLNQPVELLQRSFTDVSGIIRAIDVSSRGNNLLIGTTDGSAYRMNIATGEIVKLFEDKDGHTVQFLQFFSDPDRYLSHVEYSNVIEIYDATTDNRIHSLVFQPNELIAKLTLSPDGSRLFVILDDGQLQQWSISEQRMLKRVGQTEDFQIVTMIAKSNHEVILGGEHGHLRMVDFALAQPMGPSIEVTDSPIRSLAMHRPLNHLVVGSENGQLSIRDLSNPVEQSVAEFSLSNPVSLDFLQIDSKNDSIIAASRSGHIEVIDYKLLKPIVKPIQTSQIKHLAILPQQASFLVASDFKNFTVWDYSVRAHSSQQWQADNNAISKVARSSDGKLLAIGSEDGNISIWDIKQKQRIGPNIEGHEQAITSLLFTPDNRYLVSGSVDKSIRIWDLSTGAGVKVLNLHNDAVSFLSISPDGETMVSSSFDNQIIIWDMNTFSKKKILQTEGRENFIASSLSPDGKFIASGHIDGSIYFWDTQTGKLVNQPMKVHNDAVSALAFTPDGQTLISGSFDRTLRLIDVKSQKELGVNPISIPGIGVTDLALSPNGKIAAVSIYDSALALVDLDTSLVSYYRPHGPTQYLGQAVFSTDSKHIFVGSRAGTLYDFEFDPVQLGRRICNRLQHPLYESHYLSKSDQAICGF